MTTYHVSILTKDKEEHRIVTTDQSIKNIVWEILNAIAFNCSTKESCTTKVLTDTADRYTAVIKIINYTLLNEEFTYVTAYSCCNNSVRAI